MGNNLSQKSRRDVLKQAGLVAAVSGAGLSIETVTANQTDLELDEKQFIEIKIEYQGIDKQAYDIGCGGLKYLTGSQTVTLLNYSAWENESPFSRNKSKHDVLIGYQGNLRTPAYFDVETETRHLPTKSTFQGYSTRAVQLSEKHTPERPTIRGTESGVQIQYDNNRLHVEGKEETEMSSREKEVGLKPTSKETREEQVSNQNSERETKTPVVEPEPVETIVEPVLTVRSHGKMKFIGGKNKTVVPADSDHLLARHIKNKIDTSDTTDDLVVVSRGERK